MARSGIKAVAELPQNTWMRGSISYVRGRSFIDGTDEVARAMEAKWGVDRLRCLVDDELRARFDAQRLKFHAAMDHGELADLEREALRMRKAWVALDKAATETGARSPAPEVWEIALPDGSVAAIVKDRDGYPVEQAAGRKVRVFELFEIANLIHGFPEIVKIKQEFPGASVTAIRPRADPFKDWDTDGDEVPF